MTSKSRGIGSKIHLLPKGDLLDNSDGVISAAVGLGVPDPHRRFIQTTNTTLTDTGPGQILTEAGGTTLTATTILIGNATTADTLAVTGSGVLTLAASSIISEAVGGMAVLTDTGASGSGIVNKGTISIVGTLPVSGTLTTEMMISGNSFTNAGLISISGTSSGKGTAAIASNATLTVNDTTVANSGTITIGNLSTVSLDYSTSVTNTEAVTSPLIVVTETITNSGSITVGTGATLNIGFGGGYGSGSYSMFTNSGVITQTAGTITLLGEVTLNGTITESGSKSAFILDGILNNTGKTLFIGSASSKGSAVVGTIAKLTLGNGYGDYHYGVIKGGTIHDAGSGLISNYGTLDGVTYDGTLSVSTFGANLTIVDGITLNNLAGTGPGAMNIGYYDKKPTTMYNYGSEVYIDGSGSLNNATLTLTSTASTYVYNSTTHTGTGSTNATYIYFGEAVNTSTDTFTLGSGLMINEATTAHYIDFEDASGFNAGVHGYATGTTTDLLISNATINANAAAGVFAVTVNDFINNGPITLGGGELDIATYLAFDNTGTITAAAKTFVAIDTHVDVFGDVPTATNTGKIIITGGELQLGGTLTAGFMNGVSVTNGGTTFLDHTGVLLNSGETVNIGATSNLFFLGGTIIGGTISDAGGGLIADGGVLDGVTYLGTLTAGSGTVGSNNGSGFKTTTTTPTLTLKDGIVLEGAGGVGAGAMVIGSTLTVLTTGTTSITGGNIANYGTISVTGSLDIAGALSGSGVATVGANSTLEIDGSATGGTLVFGGANGTIDLTSGSTVTDVISGAAIGDSIDIGGVANATAVIEGQTLELFVGGVGVESIALAGNVSGEIAVSSSDGNGGTDVTFAICFLGGTGIRTPAGDVAVETLKAGDMVTLADGSAAPVVWLGVQTVATIFADPLRVMPIRIRAEALGEAMPQRDLLVSPDHALLIGDMLVHAGALVNGVSIVRETEMPAKFTYYHVEVADHSLILAENVPAETFVDNVDRMAFDNWQERSADDTQVTEMAYPRAKAFRQVPKRIHQELLARGVELYGKTVVLAA